MKKLAVWFLAMLVCAVASAQTPRETAIEKKESCEDLQTSLMCSLTHCLGAPPQYGAGLKKEAQDKRAACVAAGGNPAAGDGHYLDADQHLSQAITKHAISEAAHNIGAQHFANAETHYWFNPPDIQAANEDYARATQAYGLSIDAGEKNDPNASDEYHTAIDGYNTVIAQYEAATPQPPPEP